jgi:hypothetical protein
VLLNKARTNELSRDMFENRLAYDQLYYGTRQ